MAELFADEHVPPQVIYWLGRLGHDCHMVRQFCEDKREEGWSDEEVLRFASEREWSVVTFNARHFIALSESCPWHHGIVIGEPLVEDERKAQARRIDEMVRDELRAQGTLRGRVIDTRFTGPMPKSRTRGSK
jgi:hypothetical protein